MGYSVFFGCDNLRMVKFEENSKLESIGYRMFCSCDNLESILILNGIKSIQEQAFDGAYALDIIYYKGTVDDWDNIDIGTENARLPNAATRYYYSENEPALNADGTAYDGNYWRYVEGEPTIWTVS